MNSLKNCSNAYKVSVRRAIALLKSSLFITIPFAFCFLVSCGPGAYEKAAQEEQLKAMADSVSAYTPGIATDTINGVTHNFIRTANVKCKVKDVLQITKQIEHIVNATGGYVTQSDLNSNKDYSNNIHFRKDSLLELTYFTATSNITMRVPNKDLDSVINQITDMSVFVDFRTISSDDVKLKLYANKLAENRYKQYKTRLQNKIDTKGDKLNQVSDAEENLLDKQTLSDNKTIESYDMADRVNYSTVMLTLYQGQNTYSNIIAMPPAIETYEPPFLSKLNKSFSNGFDVLKNILLVFANMWSIILILFVLFLVIKKIVNYYTKRTPIIQQTQQ